MTVPGLVLSSRAHLGADVIQLLTLAERLYAHAPVCVVWWSSRQTTWLGGVGRLCHLDVLSRTLGCGQKLSTWLRLLKLLELIVHLLNKIETVDITDTAAFSIFRWWFLMLVNLCCRHSINLWLTVARTFFFSIRSTHRPQRQVSVLAIPVRLVRWWHDLLEVLLIARCISKEAGRLRVRIRPRERLNLMWVALTKASVRT